ncbi:MAG: hypothetical protein ACJAW8_000367 [Oleispira sp.]|jgi:uncharacterized protein YqeY
MSAIVASIKSSIKDAMRAKDKPRLSALRLASAEFKRVEVDERIDVDDERALVILDKMVKQRQNSIEQYEQADRHDLADTEKFEISIISEFLPEALSEDELAKIVADAVTQTGAASMQDMGKLMGVLKPQVQGRADMAQVSRLVKAALG